MVQYEATHRLGCYVAGLGTRARGGVFTVSDAKAVRLNLDQNAGLQRIDGKPKRKAAKPAPDKES